MSKRHGRMDCQHRRAKRHRSRTAMPDNDEMKTKSPAEIPRGFCFELREEGFCLRMILSENRKTTFRDHAASVLGRPGSVLLFQALRLSTIGAEDFDGRVRDGIGYRLLAMTTRPAKDRILKQAVFSSRLGTTI